MAWKRLRFGTVVTVLPLIPALALLYLRPVAGDPPIRLEVSLSDRAMRIIQHGDAVKTYDVAVGRPSHPTPTGRFRTGQIVWNPSWRPPDEEWARDLVRQPPGAKANPMQGVKIYFQAPDYYIHGTNDPDSIGEAASHGCIRMTVADATDLARRIRRTGGSVSLRITD
jgi:lipoprotein-anchoring transpeptidase ErfK/SrfK